MIKMIKMIKILPLLLFFFLMFSCTERGQFCECTAFVYEFEEINYTGESYYYSDDCLDHQFAKELSPTRFIRISCDGK